MPREALSLAGEQALNTLDEPFRSRAVQLIALVQHDLENWGDVYLTVEDGRRSFADQLKDYAKGRIWKEGKWVLNPAAKIVTNALPGFSAHQYNRAIHLVLRYSAPDKKDGMHHWVKDEDPRWRTIIGDRAKQLGLVWGGDISGLYDASHVEDPNWKDLAKMLAWKGIPDGKSYPLWKQGDPV